MVNKQILLDLYSDGATYDIENIIQKDFDFWVSITKDLRAKTFLELCCGTGRIGKELLSFLDLYHGVDISEPFLQTFQKKVNKPQCEFRLFNSEMQNISTGRQYDIVAIPFNSLSHIYSFDDIQSTMSNVKGHMFKDSYFIFDIHNPSLELLSRDPNKETIVKTFESEKKQRIGVFERSSFDRKTQINTISWQYKTDDDRVVKELLLPMRVFFPCEIDNMLQYNGFKIKHKYGGFDKSEFESYSPKQIFVCQR